MHDIWIAAIAIIGTIIAYLFATFLYKRIYTPLLLPVAVATVLVIIALLLFNVSYDTYMIGSKWIEAFLGPAVVALAYPLYQNRNVLKQLLLPILLGTFTGALTGIVSGVLMTKGLGFNEEVLYSITPKSVTTPVAMDISTSLTGIDSLAAVFVMIAGILGAIMGTYIFKVLRLDTNVGCGVAMGSASHAIGTSKSLENSLEQGSISTIAMILSALFVSVLAPILVMALI